MNVYGKIPGSFEEIPANGGFMETAGIEPAKGSRQLGDTENHAISRENA